MAKNCVGPNGIGEAIDRKFEFDALCIEHDDPVDNNHAMIFLAKDAALPEALKAYRAKAESLGAGPRQLQAVDLLMERVDRYQATHADRVKVPDVDEGELGDPIVAPNREPQAAS